MRTVVVCVFLAVCADAACAQSSPTRARPKLGLPSSTPATTASASAPFNAATVPDLPGLAPHPGMESEPVPGSCKVSSSMVCYDYKDGKTVFKPTRNLMPEIAGMKRESMTLKRDRITLNYSFK